LTGRYRSLSISILTVGLAIAGNLNSYGKIADALIKNGN
jgi:hypothetical protein